MFFFFLVFSKFSKTVSLLFPGSTVKGLLVLCLHKCYIWENCGSWVISLKALSQWDCKILKSTITHAKI